jgi:hypothetical protein
VQKDALVKTHNNQQQQQRQGHPHKQPATSQSKSFNPPLKKTPLPSSAGSFITSDKQGGGATVLREGHDIVTRETFCLLL